MADSESECTAFIFFIRLLFIILLIILNPIVLNESIAQDRVVLSISDYTSKKSLSDTSSKARRLVQIDENQANQILVGRPSTIRLRVKGVFPRYQDLTLRHYKVFTSDFRSLINAKNSNLGGDIKSNFHAFKTYSPEGKVTSITVSKYGVSGILSTDSNSYVLHPKENQKRRYNSVHVVHRLEGSIDCRGAYHVGEEDGLQNINDILSDDDVLSRSIYRTLSRIKNNANIDSVDVEIALESDYETFQDFGSAEAVTTHMANVVAAASPIFERDLGVRLTLSAANVWTTSDDPYSSESMLNILLQFNNYWNDNMQDVDRTISHMLTSRPISGTWDVGGIAISKSRGPLRWEISPSSSYAVTKTRRDDLPVRTFAHEIGHNFGSPHTHSCSWPGGPIDRCAPAEGACTHDVTQETGTIMSYCSSRELRFHSLVAKRTRYFVEHSSYADSYYRIPVVKADSSALLDLFEATNGSGWNRKSNWKETPVLDWQGVMARNGRVIRLDLRDNNLTGVFPESITSLGALNYIFLDNNHISGSIPSDIGNLSELRWLGLASNKLSGSIPSGLGNLRKMVHLKMPQNNIEGQIPSNLGNLTQLDWLDLGSNALTGSIPPEIGQLTKLRTLALYNNELSGAVPEQIGDLTNLSNLQLSGNSLESVPSSIGNLNKLNVLDFRGNRLTKFPPNLNSMENLEGLLLGSNNIDTWPKKMKGLSNLTDLVVRRNKLTTVPAYVDSLRLTRLDVRRNEITNLPDFRQFEVDRGVSDPNTYLLVSRNKLTFEDIEKNIDVATNFDYAPQDKVGDKKDISVQKGDSLSTSVSVGGVYNTYQWYKNGEIIPGAQDSTYVVPFAEKEDEGTYTCEISNTVATELKLKRRPITVQVVAPPPPPAGLMATGMNKEVQLSWDGSSDPDLSHYSLYRNKANDATGANVLDEVNAIDSSYTDSEVKNGTTYYYWLTAVDTAGSESNFSESAAATPQDRPPSKPKDVSATRIGNTRAELSWHASSVSDLLGYYVYRSSKPFNDTLSASRLNRRVLSQPNYTDSTVLVGKTYYYRVVASDTARNMSSLSESASVFLYPENIEVTIERTFPSSSTERGFRLVSLPGEVNKSLASTLAGRAGVAWQAYWDDGSESDYLVRFDGSDRFRFEPGVGFWLVSTSDWSVEETFETVALEGDTVTTTGLHDGWNIISNPLDKDVAWARIGAATGDTLQSLWRFNGSFVEADTFASAKGGEAFYFLNDHGLDELTIPYPGAPEADTSKRAKKRSAANVLALRAGRRGSERTRVSSVKVGYHQGATRGLDSYDQFAPPGRFEAVRLRLVAPKGSRSKRRRYLAHEYRPAGKEGQTFQLVLRSEAGAPVRLSAEGVDEIPSASVSLINERTARTYDLRAEPSVTLTPQDSTAAYRLVVGTSAYAERERSEVLPDRLELLPNYPNPFSGQTTLEYALPTEARVRLAIYDVLGRRVRVLTDDHRRAGRHQARWNGRNTAGQPVASGIYIGRLIADTPDGERSQTQKMVLVR